MLVQVQLPPPISVGTHVQRDQKVQVLPQPPDLLDFVDVLWHICWMKEKRTLIIADIHLKWELAEEIIAAVEHDDVTFLGDYFDDFNDNADMIGSTCEWLGESVKKPNRRHLWGNHDVHYAFPYRTFKCSGYEQWKEFVIQDILPRGTWEKLEWYCFLGDAWLISHAGLHKQNLPEDIRNLYTDRPAFFDAIGKYLDEEIKKGFRSAANNQGSWIFNAGFARGGSQRVGGITWCDFNREFYPILGLNQIVGHTVQIFGDVPAWIIQDSATAKPNLKMSEKSVSAEKAANVNASYNVCLDVRRNLYYAVWDGKNLTPGSYNGL